MGQSGEGGNMAFQECLDYEVVFKIINLVLCLSTDLNSLQKRNTGC